MNCILNVEKITYEFSEQQFSVFTDGSASQISKSLLFTFPDLKKQIKSKDYKKSLKLFGIVNAAAAFDSGACISLVTADLIVPP